MGVACGAMMRCQLVAVRKKTLPLKVTREWAIKRNCHHLREMTHLVVPPLAPLSPNVILEMVKALGTRVVPIPMHHLDLRDEADARQLMTGFSPVRTAPAGRRRDVSSHANIEASSPPVRASRPFFLPPPESSVSIVAQDDSGSISASPKGLVTRRRRKLAVRAEVETSVAPEKRMRRNHAATSGPPGGAPFF